MNSWRQYGGIHKSQGSNKITINSIVTDNLLERTALAGEFRVDGNAAIGGKLIAFEIDNVQHASINDLSINNVGQINKLSLGNSFNNYFTGDSNGISMNHNNAEANLDIIGNNNVTKFTSNSSTVNNIIASTVDKYGILCGTDLIDENNYESYIAFFNNYTFNNNTKNIDISGTQVDARLVYSTTDNTVRIEAPFQYSDNKQFLYAIDAYDNDLIQTGYSLKLISAVNNDFSNTAARITNTNGKGIVIGGGASPNFEDLNDQRPFGYIGTIDGFDDSVIPFMVAERSERNFNKKFHIGINTYKPKKGDTLIDINGKVILNYGEVAVVTTQNVEPFKIIYHPYNVSDPNNGYTRTPFYAVSGSPYAYNSNSNEYSYNITYTINGGQDWNTEDIDVTNNQSLKISGSNLVLSNFLPDENDTTGKLGLQFLVGNNNSFYYTNTFGGLPFDFQGQNIGGWKFFTVIGTTNESSNFKVGSDFTNIIINKFKNDENEDILRLLFTELIYTNGSPIGSDGNLNEFSYYIDLDISIINDIKISTFSQLEYNNINPVDIVFIPNLKYSIVLDDNTIFAVGNGVYKYDKNFNFINGYNPHNINVVYNYIFRFNNNYLIAVGENIISITRDSGATWNDTIVSSIDGINILNPIINSVYVLDDYIGLDFLNNPIELGNIMAVGDNGIFLYSLDRGISWKLVPTDALNGSGTGERIYSSTSKLLDIYIEDTTSMVITRKINDFAPATSTANANIGQFMIHYLTIPYLFNYKSVDILDICGNVTVQGDLRINNGELQTNTDTFNFINRTEKFLNMGANLEIANMGKDDDTQFKMNGNILLSNSIVIGKDFNSSNIDYSTSIDVSGNIIQNGCVYQF